MEKFELTEEVDVCNSCWNKIKKGRCPEMSMANGLLPDEVPDVIKDLNWIELMCIQRIRPIQVLIQILLKQFLFMHM